MNKKEESNSGCTKFGCGVSIILLLLVVGYLIYDFRTYSFPEEHLFEVEYGDAGDVAVAFAYLLPYHRSGEIRSYISDDAWKKVEKFERTTEVLPNFCYYPILDAEIYPWVWVFDFEEENEATVTVFYEYTCSDGFYRDWIDVELVKTNDNWEIVDWGEAH